MVFYCNLYYIVVLAWALYYLFASISAASTGSDLPWATCGNDWNTPDCFSVASCEGAGNGTACNGGKGSVDAAVEFWE